MKKYNLLILAVTLSAWATDFPPVIPDGPISYDEVSYAPANGPEADPFATGPAAYNNTYKPVATPSPYAEPITPSSTSQHNLLLKLDAYISDYQVRGMGVTNEMSHHGCSGIGISYTPTNRNLFRKGIYQTFSGSVGLVWSRGDKLGDGPGYNAHYALGKEIFPNLTLEAGYTLRYGGLEGYMAKHHRRASHSVAQDLNLTLAFDDHQRGFFGHAQWGWGFQGLKGHYMDFEAGYRFTDVLNTQRFGADLEVSAGMAPSFGYWGHNVHGVDAYRLKLAVLPYTHSGTVGRDGAWQIKPWIQCSWTGNNASKIDHTYGYCPVDHFQVTLGLELNYRF